jgi:TetR/AcrR family transcriptional regulator, regulator of cefoperazone and chloramphenicol sensitivity
MAADRSGHPDADLTARARIRNAALRLFAERGIGPATIRDIAIAAGVSPALVRHHFGSKGALREACDAYAMDQMNRIREQIFVEGRLRDHGFMASVHPTASLLQGYLVRSLMDGSPAAESMFDEMVQTGERWLAERTVECTDRRGCAAVLVAMQMGVFLLPGPLSQVLGVEVATTEGQVRINRAFVDLFSQPQLTADEARQAHAGLDRQQGRD